MKTSKTKEINPRLAELKKEIDGWKVKEEVALKHNSTALAEHYKNKLSKLQDEYDRLEEKEAGKVAMADIIEEKVSMMPKTRAKRAAKTAEKAPKKTRKTGKYHISTLPTMKKQRIGLMHTLVRNNTDHYTVWDKEDKALFDIERHADKKWHVTCRTKEKKEFVSLQEAVNHIGNELYNKDVLPILKAKKAELLKNKERIEKRKAEGKPIELTATETAEKMTEKVVEKLEKKIDKGQSVTKDFKGTFNKFNTMIKEFRLAIIKNKDIELDRDSVKSEIDLAIKELEKLKKSL